MPRSLKNERMLKAEEMETLLYGCVRWTLGQGRFAELRTAHHYFFLRIIVFQRRQRTDYLMSYAEAFKKEQCESIEKAIHKRRLLFAGGVQRNDQSAADPADGLYGTIVSVEFPKPGRPETNCGRNI